MFHHIFSKLKNAQKNNLKFIELNVNISKKLHSFLLILYKEGYINNFCYKYDKNNKLKIIILLKYDINNKQIITNIKQISKPGYPVYCNSKLLWKIKHGFGIYILSTTYGLLTDFEARLLNVGGKLLCVIY